MTQGRTDGSPPNQRRVTVREAVAALGISEGAVRMRIKRGTLESTREGERLYVLLHTDPTPDPTRSDSERLISTLEEQLRLEREAHAEARRIIAGLVERIPALEAPESPETPSEGRSSTTGPPETPAEARPWWRRMFGG
jgi:hypothetical protein